MPGVPTLFNAILNAPELRRIRSALPGIFASRAGPPCPMNFAPPSRPRAPDCWKAMGSAKPRPSSAAIRPIRRPGIAPSGSVGLPYPRHRGGDSSVDPRRASPGDRRDGRNLHQRPPGHGGILEAPRRDGESVGRRGSGDRRHGPSGRDGYVFLTDRLKDMIIAGGFKIYPRNIEEAIMLHRQFWNAP